MNNDISTYLTFKVGTHLFGVDVSKVLEISEFKEPQRVPESPAYMLGVLEFRDQVIPMIDCGLKFGLSNIEITEVTCMVVLELYNVALAKKMKVSIVVDTVSDVFESSFHEKLTMEDDFKPGYVESSYKTDSGLVMVLDADKVFSEKEIITLSTLMGKL
jgi:purine-binding chemotaxis protein CheW